LNLNFDIDLWPWLAGLFPLLDNCLGDR